MWISTFIHSVLYQMEGLDNVFSNHHTFKCSGSPLIHVRFDQSLTVMPFDAIYDVQCDYKSWRRLQIESKHTELAEGEQ